MKKVLVALYRLITLNFTKRLSYRRLRENATRTAGFQGKILKKMAFDRDPRLTLFADKIRVRDFVASRIGEQHLARAYFTAMKGETINWSALPNEFVAKTNHGSGGERHCLGESPPVINLSPMTRRNMAGAQSQFILSSS